MAQALIALTILVLGALMMADLVQAQGGERKTETKFEFKS